MQTLQQQKKIRWDTRLGVTRMVRKTIKLEPSTKIECKTYLTCYNILKNARKSINWTAEIFLDIFVVIWDFNA